MVTENAKLSGHNDEDDFVDDQLDFSELEERFQVPFEEGFDAWIVVDGLPIVGEEKKNALLKLVSKLFGKRGTIKTSGPFMPMEEVNSKQMSQGFLFLEYENPQQANRAIQELNDHPLDKRHTLKVNLFTDVEKYANVPDEFEPPQEEPYFEQEHLRSWLADYQGRDQFAMYKGDDVLVAWNRKNKSPESVVNRPNWTERFIQWSPLGTFLVSIHSQGLQIWGGPSWKRIHRFAHPGINLVDFSPKERYVVTWSDEPLRLPPANHPARANLPFSEDDEGKQLFIWDVQTGAILRSFPTPAHEVSKGVAQKISWPLMKWSIEEKYFARVTPGQQLSIYEAPGMGLLDRKSIKIESIVDFEWIPAETQEAAKTGQQILAYWTPEVGNQPARVSLMTVPNKEVVRTKNLFQVSNCKFHWQSAGQFLCVNVGRHTKTKKKTFSNLEIFRLTEKNIPVEVVELKEDAIAFAWEPKGDRFVLITSNDPNFGSQGVAGRTILSFYALEKGKGAAGAFKCIRSIDNKKTCNSIFWSPIGRFVLVATLGCPTVYGLEFWDCDLDGEKRESEKEHNANLTLMNQGEHFGITDIEWDPSGRYIATSSSNWIHAMENGFKLWDFRGTLLFEQPFERFKQFLWRPRPQSLLSKEAQKKVRKNLRDYSRIFDEEDAQAASMANTELVEQHRKMLADWRAFRAQKEAELRDLGLFGEQKEDSKDEVIEMIVEELIDETEEVVKIILHPASAGTGKDFHLRPTHHYFCKTMNNATTLDRGFRVYQQKKKKKSIAIPEITFDAEERCNFLTGFRKRKLERQAKAKEEIEKELKRGKIELRRKAREERKAQLDENISQIKNKIGLQSNEISFEEQEYEEWNGFDNLKDTTPIESERTWKNEYDNGEGEHTTVTVIEGIGEEYKVDHPLRNYTTGCSASSSKLESKTTKKTYAPKTKKRFRYASKTERQALRKKR
ncbi:Eukaryotic translation initiation factor 3 subunit B [Neolecta irregularis DAH-3]|uniref:Eukaryotic translation initiation factor 3 subunit B n=1 Tax=Neolecta irregularis (strain DAH-3) TaxID=1198029 RepID=A0A1U7LW44_NEOID|nr:Eukaryotic translation initiation factor 3 subunit B [Neolecta irregularis DAH-3]|eukprot:OLL26854.1 Eukaryotic translation initiation factor 3 subunit B [Neolecta irregularis DAH-3]